MGVNIDPDYNKNHWLYLFYSPQTGKADTAQHLSRFTYDDVKDTLIMSSEKVLLKVPVKRDGCCHTGGSIAWDKSGNLEMLRNLYNLREPIADIIGFQNDLLSILKESGIGLYEANNSLSSWSELSINENNPDGIPNKTNCN